MIICINGYIAQQRSHESKGKSRTMRRKLEANAMKVKTQLMHDSREDTAKEKFDKAEKKADKSKDKNNEKAKTKSKTK